MFCIRKDDCLNYIYQKVECRKCQKNCPENAIIIKRDGRTWMDRNKCTQCGSCELYCIEDAIYDDGSFFVYI